MRIFLAFIPIVFGMFYIFFDQISSTFLALDNSLKATLITALVAIIGVLFSQWCFDERQVKQHAHDLKVKEYERKQDKTEEIIALEKSINATAFLLADNIAAYRQEQSSNFLREISKLKVELSGELAQFYGLIEIYFNTISTTETNELSHIYNDLIGNMSSCLSGTNISNPYDLTDEFTDKITKLSSSTIKELIEFRNKTD